jgi:hypothetical protein
MVTSIKGNDTSTFGGNIDVPQIVTDAPAFRAYNTSNQAISSQVWTKVTLDAEEFDTNNQFDSTTNYRFTPSVAGYYHVSCSVRAIDLEQQIAGLYKNGSVYSYGSYIQNCIISKHTDLVYLNGTTDYIEMYYFAVTAATLNSGSVNTYFAAHLARAV